MFSAALFIIVPNWTEIPDKTKREWILKIIIRMMSARWRARRFHLFLPTPLNKNHTYK